MRNILGVSAFYHDSAAALLRDGVITAAAQEERFTRKKNDESFPANAIQSCLEIANLTEEEIDAVVFYDKPVAKFVRVLETFLAIAPKGAALFARAMPSWMSEKTLVDRAIGTALPGLRPDCKRLFTAHHQAHAASAFYPSPFENAAILTVDGVGEWATTTIGRGQGNELALLKELRFPHSLGMLYSAFTAYCGFRVNSGEYKLMGLAPYGTPRYAAAIHENLIDLSPDGSFRLNLDFFDFLRGKRMTNKRFDRLFGGPPRVPESDMNMRYADVAASIQDVTTTVMLSLAKQAKELTGEQRLCLAGGVALNCVTNGRLTEEKIFEEIWVQPAAGDAGGALGAALCAWHQHLTTAAAQESSNRRRKSDGDAMRGSLLGPEFSSSEIEQALADMDAKYKCYDSYDETVRTASRLLAEGKILGWFQGRMEFGPRALGNRSILGDPRNPDMQLRINLKVKFRESFRPFAPAVLAKHATEYFDLKQPSPYMLVVAPVAKAQRLEGQTPSRGFDRLNERRSRIPAVTHVDDSARVQTVSVESNPRFHSLLTAFHARTGCPLLINTSFNVRGEPVVCSPKDAFRCFMKTEIDYLVIGNCLLARESQV